MNGHSQGIGRLLGAVATVVAIHGAVAASPIRIASIVMLMDGALERIAQARGCIAARRAGDKNGLLGAAVAIIDELRCSLDLKAGGPSPRTSTTCTTTCAASS